MKKADDYVTLRAAGLPTPLYAVFDERCLEDSEEWQRLNVVVAQIIEQGSGAVGVRTEPKMNVSPLGSYPHHMPLTSVEAVRNAINGVMSGDTSGWWFLINEAFEDYVWNAVVMVRSDRPVVGGAELVGEVNYKDNVPLRPALANSENVVPVSRWTGGRTLVRLIHRSGLLNRWLEVSKVLDHGRERLVFWGMR